MAFDLDGQLWEVEMGPRGGDELNRVVRGANYGYPIVSNGDHYDGRKIPDHDTHPEFHEPAVWGTPVVSPGDLMIYRGDLFPDWRGDAFVAGLSSRAIVRVRLDGNDAREVERYDMGARIRSVGEGPDGAIWALEDDRGDSTRRLLELTPKDGEGMGLAKGPPMSRLLRISGSTCLSKRASWITPQRHQEKYL